ncbi:MAG: BatD family protein [Ginsengibacter sp.]
MNKILRSVIYKNIFLFLPFFYFAFQINTKAVAQVKFSAVCPNKQISKNEYLQVQYIVENASNVEQIVPPSFKNFSIISGPNQQSGVSSINGNIKQFIALEYILKPQRTGNFTLDPATAKADGKTLRSNSLSVVVNNKSSGTSPGATMFSPFANIITDPLPATRLRQFDDYILHKGENIQEKIKKNLFINVSVNKTTCYVGEPIVASYKLYTRLKSESNLIKSPSFNGFSVSEMELPDNYTLSTEKYNGREYSVYTLRKVQLYPLRPDTVELGPIEVENRVTFIKDEYANAQRGDIFYDMLRQFADASAPNDAIEEQKIILQSKPLNIIVKPLPELGKPKEFRGAVGDFSIAAEVQKTNMTTDEAGNFVISILGRGNMQMINAPSVLWPEGTEAFEPKLSENIDKTTVPLRGKKIFNYPFTVSRPGKYFIPPVTFSYFDVETQAYKTVSTKPLSVEVKNGNGVRPLVAGHLISSKNKPATFTGKIFAMRWFLIISIFMLAGLIFWFAKKVKAKNSTLTTVVKDENNNTEGVVKTTGAEIPKNPLLEAEEIFLENNANNFYPVINNCLRRYLSAKLNFPEKELNKKKLNELLDKHNVGVGTTVMLTSLMENIELNLYAPLSPVNQMQEVYEKASEVVSLLDKQVC